MGLVEHHGKTAYRSSTDQPYRRLLIKEVNRAFPEVDNITICGNGKLTLTFFLKEKPNIRSYAARNRYFRESLTKFGFKTDSILKGHGYPQTFYWAEELKLFSGKVYPRRLYLLLYFDPWGVTKETIEAHCGKLGA